jgi:hypothetical protein
MGFWLGSQTQTKEPTMARRSNFHNGTRVAVGRTAGAVSATAPSGSASATDLRIAYLPPEQLRPSSNNARRHSKKQLNTIAQSIERFGFLNPVLIADGFEIIAGHGRVEAVPTVLLSNLSPADRRAYMITDNRLAQLAGWDRALLASELHARRTVEVPQGPRPTGLLKWLHRGRGAAGEASPARHHVPEGQQGRSVTRQLSLPINKHKGEGLLRAQALFDRVVTENSGAEKKLLQDAFRTQAMEDDALLESIVNEMFEVLWTFGQVAERCRAGSAGTRHGTEGYSS